MENSQQTMEPSGEYSLNFVSTWPVAGKVAEYLKEFATELALVFKRNDEVGAQLKKDSELAERKREPGSELFGKPFAADEAAQKAKLAQEQALAENDVNTLAKDIGYSAKGYV